MTNEPKPVTVEEILEQIDKDINKPFVTAKFGNHWIEHAKANYDIDAVIDIAWTQGRRAILLERTLRELLAKSPSPVAQQPKVKINFCKGESMGGNCIYPHKSCEKDCEVVVAQQPVQEEVPDEAEMELRKAYPERPQGTFPSIWADGYMTAARKYRASQESQRSDAVEFGEWLSNNRYWYNIDVEGTWYKLLPNKYECDMSKRYTTSQLYNLFKQQKQ
jgi:hypothetical protein